MEPFAEDLNGLQRLTRADIKPAVEVLVRAFHEYPLLTYYYPDTLNRQKVAGYFLSFAVLAGIRYGEVFATSPDMEGIAVWMPSENYPVSVWKMLRAIPLSVIFGFGRSGGYKMKLAGEHIDAVHKRLATFRHGFLQTIGVDPQFQGNGYAGKLLRPVLARMDKDSLPCYLETLDEKNVALYEHFGFGVIDKSAIRQTELTSWAMLREAR